MNSPALSTADKVIILFEMLSSYLAWMHAWQMEKSLHLIICKNNFIR